MNLENFISTCLHESISTVSYFIITVYIFGCKYKFNAKKLGAWFVVFLLSLFLFYKGSVSLMFITLVMTAALVSVFIDEKRSKKIVFIVLAMLLESFIQLLLNYIFGFNNQASFSIESLIMTLFTLCTVIVLSFIIVKKFKRNYSEYFGDRLSYIYINLMIGICAGIFPILLINLYENSLNSRISLAIIFTSTITIIATLITSIFYLKKSKENQEFKTEIMLQKKINEMEEEHFIELVESYKNLKVFKHDMKAHFKILNNLIKLNKTEELEQYIEDLSDVVQPDKLSQCANVYIAATLNQLLGQIESNQIEFKMEYGLVETLNMKSLDICSLIHNLVSNAIEATVKCTDKKRLMYLSLTQIEKSLRIIIVNTVYIDFSLDELKRGTSSKEDAQGHGFGLISIDKIIEQYHGDLHCELDNGNLISTIILLNVF